MSLAVFLAYFGIGLALCLLLAMLHHVYRFLRLLDKGCRRSTAVVLSVVPALGFTLLYLLLLRAQHQRIDFWAVCLAALMVLISPFITKTLGWLLVPRTRRRTGPNTASHVAAPFGRRCNTIASTVGAILMFGSIPGFWFMPHWYLVLPVLFLGVAFTVVSLAFDHWIYRKKVPTFIDEQVAGDSRPGVLYIRAFAQERDYFVWARPKVLAERIPNFKSPEGQRYGAATFEQFLTYVCTRDFGPFVALGNPGDEAPPNGAVRGYYQDRDWETVFCRWAEWARVIVIQVSSSLALNTELNHIVRRKWQTKLFIVTVPDPWTKSPAATNGVVLLRMIGRLPRTKWSEMVRHFPPELNLPGARPAPGTILTFDEEGQSISLVTGFSTPDEVSQVIQARLSVVAKAPMKSPPQKRE